MRAALKPEDVEMACRDLEAKTLLHLPGEFARLIYLASTRDYNSGRYYHAGLAHQFGDQAAASALASCHREAFRGLVLCPVSELAQQLEAYLSWTRLPLSEFARAWGQLQPYRIAIPLNCSPITARFFATNVTAALAILQARQTRANPPGPRSA
jgi:hypothetical protein